MCRSTKTSRRGTNAGAPRSPGNWDWNTPCDRAADPASNPLEAHRTPQGADRSTNVFTFEQTCQQAGTAKICFQFVRQNDGHFGSIVNAEAQAANTRRTSVE